MASRHPPKPRGAAGAVALGACPICGKPADASSRPFCSPRCRDVDLHRWLSGAYAIPVVEEDGADGDDER
jgi:endogenous inhibitor of DNA gyrase (YacG/DUF329 family)